MNIKVLMVIPHIQPDLTSGNYRRIIELLSRGHNVGISYGTLEIRSLVRFRRLLKKFLNVNLSICPLQVFEFEGFDIGGEYSIRGLGRTIVNIIKVIRTLLAIRRTWNPDIVHVPDALFSWIVVGCIAKIVLRKPLVITIQLVPRWIAEAGHIGFKAFLRHFTKKYGLLKGLAFSIGATIHAWILKNSYIILVSKAELDQLRGIDRNKVFINPNGISVTELKSPKVYEACFVGYHDQRKGIFDLLEAWSIVVKTNPKARLVTMGGIDDAVREKWIKVIKAKNLEGNVIYLGKVPERKKYEVLSQCMVFLYPSYHESQSLAFGEALGLGVPAVGYNIPALRECYGECPATFLCKPGDAECLARYAMHIINLDRETYMKLSAKASHFIRLNYSWDKMLIREKLIYLKILLNEARSRKCSLLWSTKC